MESWVSWPLWLAQRALCSRPLVEARMLQYTRSPPAPVTLMQGPSTSPALRKGPERTPAAGTSSAALCGGPERALAADAADACTDSPFAGDTPAEGGAYCRAFRAAMGRALHRAEGLKALQAVLPGFLR